jgi:L-alanine-DL-glutamate epimerase-like enolase superfamily enzyme
VEPDDGLRLAVRIAALRALPVTYPFEREPLSYCYVRAETDDGLVGWGEVCDSFGCTYAGVVAAVIEQALAPLLAGQELIAVEALSERMRLFTRRRLGDQWVAAQARSGVEIALWDLVGKWREAPVSALLGRLRDRVEVYASHTFLEEGDLEWHLGALAPLLERGVRMVKVRLGPDWRPDLDLLGALRRELPPAVELMVDGSEIFTVATAVEVAKRLDALGITFFEEPIPQHERAGIEELVRRSPVAIAYGEHLFGVEDALEALGRARVGVLQPDASTCGGIGEARTMARLAAAHGARVVLHHAAGGIALAANLHVAASVQGVRSVEYSHVLAEGLRLVTGAPLGLEAIEDGHLAVPDGPGLGVELDEEAARHHRYRPDPTRVAGSRAGLPDRFVGDR